MKIFASAFAGVVLFTAMVACQPASAQKAQIATPKTTPGSPAPPVQNPPAPAPGTPMPLPNDPLALYKRTGINQEQIDKINSLTNDFQNLLTAKTQVLIGLMRDMRELSVKPDPDEKAVMAKQAEINTLNNDMANQRLKLMLNIRHVLTPEQKETLVQFMQQGPRTAPVETEGRKPSPSASKK